LGEEGVIVVVQGEFKPHSHHKLYWRFEKAWTEVPLRLNNGETTIEHFRLMTNGE